MRFSGYQTSNPLKWNPKSISSTFLQSFRLKQWDFYGFYSKNLTICVALADIGYVKNAFITVYNGKTKPMTYDKLIFPWEKVQMSQGPEEGHSFYYSNDLIINFSNEQGGIKRIFVRSKEVDLDLILRKRSGQEDMAYYGAFSKDMRQFAYTNKAYNYIVDGNVRIWNDNVEVNNLLAMMDWTRGIWPYQGGWRWMSGMGRFEGMDISINLGEISHEREFNQATDDCVYINEHVIKLGNVNMNQDPDNDKIWHINTITSKPTPDYASFQGTFTISKIFHKQVNFWLIQSYLYQHFGEIQGTLTTTFGSLDFKIQGIFERHFTRW